MMMVTMMIMMMMMMMTMTTILGKTTRTVYSSFKVVRCEIEKNIYVMENVLQNKI